MPFPPACPPASVTACKWIWPFQTLKGTEGKRLIQRARFLPRMQGRAGCSRTEEEAAAVKEDSVQESRTSPPELGAARQAGRRQQRMEARAFGGGSRRTPSPSLSLGRTSPVLPARRQAERLAAGALPRSHSTCARNDARQPATPPMPCPGPAAGAALRAGAGRGRGLAPRRRWPSPPPPAGRGSFRFPAGRRSPAGPDWPPRPASRRGPPIPSAPKPLRPDPRVLQGPTMGQAKSRRRGRGTTPPSSPETPSRMDSTLLPQELLVLILSWVPGRTLVTVGRLVCRQWRDLIDSPTLWKLQAERDPSKREAFQAALEAAPHCPCMEWGRVGVLQPFGRNLIKNPHGEEEFQHWQVGHGDGVCLGDNACTILQVVDLVKEGLWEDLLDNVQPDIFVSDWWGTREKCRCTYTFFVTLQGVDKMPIAQFETERYFARPSEEGNLPFQQTSHVFRKYGPGARYVWFQHLGRNPTAEQTEPHITNSTVLVKLSG